MGTGKRDILEEQIRQWQAYLHRHKAIHHADAEELESHLRDQIEGLVDSGLADDEAFLVAVKRMGNLDSLSREFAREHSERLWKQLVVTHDAGVVSRGGLQADIAIVLLLAAAAALAIKVPQLFGYTMDDPHVPFYARNLSFFVLPLLTGYFVWKRRINWDTCLWFAMAFIMAAVFANVYPFQPESHTQILSALHLPIALWLIVGIAYVGGHWRADGGRMNFIRFSGELFIYYVLIALGGGVLTAFTAMMFDAIGLDVEWFAAEWLIPCGAMGAVIVGAWLVEAKQSVIENMAPVLTRLFTPLFTLVLLAFLITMIWTGSGFEMEREVLIGFDLLLVVVLGLLLYNVSARDPLAKPDAFDMLQLLLVISALIVDIVALGAIAGRISEFGFTPNRIAALGENIILLINLSWSAWLYGRFILGHGSFASLERWQTDYLPVYSVWAGFVVIAFPPLFGYA
ncbi:MAG: permease prefix domain 1-containing protein [Balneolaceae bacterium]